MIYLFILLTIFLSSATCRTARDYRVMADSARLSQAEFPAYNLIAPNGPGTYAFGYEIEDPVTKNVQFRDEERLPNGTVRGSYGVLLPDNTLHITRYIADQFGYRANSETKKKLDNSPLKIELQVQPTVGARPNSFSTTSPSPLRTTTARQFPFTNPTTTTTSFPTPIETMNPSIDPIVASQIYQQHQINLNPTYNPLRDPNILDPYISNAFLNQQYYVPQNQNPYFNSGLRQNYDGTVSTYQAQSRPPTTYFPFFNNLLNGNNQYSQNNPIYYSDQQQSNRPVIDFITNLANNNPLTNFISNWGQNENPNTPIQNILNNLNPLNLFTNNNNNNNNRPQVSLPLTQSDYIASVTHPPPMSIQQQQQTPSPFIQTSLSNNLDNSVFSNDHFLNPTSQFYPNTVPTNPQVVHSYYPSHSQFQPYSAISNRYPTQYYNPYNNNYYSHNRKKTNKRKKNKNKVDLDSESDWFQDFLDKRKEASLDISTRRTSSKGSSDEEDDDVNLDEYFR